MAKKSKSPRQTTGKHWTQEEPHRSLIEQGLEWAAKTPAAETDLEDLIRRVEQARKDNSIERKR